RVLFRSHLLLEYVDELCLVHANLRNQRPFLSRLVDTVNPLTIDFQEPRAFSGQYMPKLAIRLPRTVSCSVGAEPVGGWRIHPRRGVGQAGRVRGFQLGRRAS